MKRNRKRLYTTCLLFSLVGAGVVMAVDSVSNTPCLPGDGLDPWSTGSQVKKYVVDLAPLTTSWGTNFGIAPIIKSSKSGAGFFGSLTSAHTISRNQLQGIALNGSYPVWNTPGVGIHPTNNTAPASFVNVTGLTGNQFAAAVTEFATTDLLKEYTGVLGALVAYEPANPSRLFVDRVVAATNSCDNNSSLASFGLGAINAAGFLHFRADNFGVAGGCGLTNSAGNNIYRVDLAARNPAALNVISNNYPAGLFDAPSTDWIVRASATSYNTPNIQSSTGDLLATNFNIQYEHGPDFGSLTTEITHLAPGVVDQRGNPSYSGYNCSFINSAGGLMAVLGQEADGLTNDINLWGLTAAGGVSGRIKISLPAVVTDNSTGFTNLPGDNEFDHYHSQVAFRGGNGQVAIGRDGAGRILVAAQVSHPIEGGPDWPVNYIGVARLDCGSGATQWTMAGYNDGTIGELGTGKPVLDGPGGNVIGRMVTLDNVTGGAPFGPSVSAPMIDGAGNVWFLSALELFDGMGGSTFNSGLLRAVYDPASFSYQLELVMKLGDEFHGQNSQTDYLISFMGIADSNSVDSGTAWSQNISERIHGGGIAGPAQNPAAPTSLGGLVIAAEIVYDTDADGDFDQPCDVAGGDDQDYRVLLYIGATDPIVAAPESPVADPTGITKTRFLSFSIPESAAAGVTESALRVNLTTLHQVDPPYSGGTTIPFTAFEGQSVWVGPPSTYLESSSSGVSFSSSFTQCTPHYQDWSTVGLLHVTGTAIVPSSTYRIENVAASCQGNEGSAPCLSGGSSVSSQLEIKTTRWGDVDAPYNPPSPTVQPDISDVSSLVNKFRSAPAAPIKARSVIAGAPGSPWGEITASVMNVDVGFSHISACVDAFRGTPYPYKMGECATGGGACTTSAECTGSNGPPCFLYCP